MTHVSLNNLKNENLKKWHAFVFRPLNRYFVELLKCDHSFTDLETETSVMMTFFHREGVVMLASQQSFGPKR